MNISENILQIQQVLKQYPKAGLLAVTKGRSQKEILELVKSDLHKIGENRIQEAETKFPSLPQDLEKHLIGHLQSNKVRRAVKIFDVIESVDSFEIAEKIGGESVRQNKIMPIFLQVNISDEVQKFGFSESKILKLFSKIDQINGLKIVGLMCIPEHTKDEDQTRSYFRRMKKLHTNIVQHFLKNSERNFELSMGMSHDYKIALAEGATLIRIGSRLFEE